MRILIAEDDLTCRTVLAGVLTKEGHEVTAACDGAEAWEMLQEPDAPRLVILDWMMPRLDGVDVVRLVRASPSPHPPYIVMLTAKGEKADIVAGLAAGANDYLPKPFDPDELRARIDVGRRMVEMQEELARRIDELNDALEHIKTLRGIIPICSGCKKIRDDHGYWRQVEAYVAAHTDAEFSHSICPDCMARLYPEFP